jgi:hypothetical protein
MIASHRAWGANITYANITSTAWNHPNAGEVNKYNTSKRRMDPALT